MKRVDFVKVQLVREKVLNYEVSCASDGVSILRSLGIQDNPEEVFYVMCLNTKGRIVNISEVSHGTVSMAPVEMSGIFSRAILSNASSIIIAHSHPSGDPHPSDADRILTDRVKQAGEIMGIRLVDHLIIGEPDYFSFAGAGML